MDLLAFKFSVKMSVKKRKNLNQSPTSFSFPNLFFYLALNHADNLSPVSTFFMFFFPVLSTDHPTNTQTKRPSKIRSAPDTLWRIRKFRDWMTMYRWFSKAISEIYHRAIIVLQNTSFVMNAELKVNFQIILLKLF